MLCDLNINIVCKEIHILKVSHFIRKYIHTTPRFLPVQSQARVSFASIAESPHQVKHATIRKRPSGVTAEMRSVQR